MRRLVLAVVATGLAAVAAVVLAVYWYEKPSVLRIAVTRNSDDQAILAAAAQQFAKDRDQVRLKLVIFDTLVETARALEQDQVDLAVVRSDINMPPRGQTVLIMHRNAAVLVAPAQSGIHFVNELHGRRIGVIQGQQGEAAGDQTLLDAALSQYDVTPEAVRRVFLSLPELPKAIKRKDVDAVLMVDSIGSADLTETVAALTRFGRGQPTFIPVSEAKAIAQRLPCFESMEVVRGAFGGAQPRPAANFETLGVTTRLVAQHNLNDDVVGALTGLLLTARPSIAAHIPAANRIEAPPTDKGLALPVHPGALAYLNDEEQTIFEKYSDFIYISAMFLSLIGTALAAIAARLNRSQGSDVERILQRLLEIIKQARCVECADALDDLEKEADDLLALALARDASNAENPHRLTATSLALNQVRHAIAEKRQTLASGSRPVFAPRLVRE